MNRLQHETTVTVLFPDDPVARESVADYIRAMKSMYPRAVKGRRRCSFARSPAPLTALAQQVVEQCGELIRARGRERGAGPSPWYLQGDQCRLEGPLHVQG